MNSPSKDYSYFMCYSPDTQYIFAEFWILFIHWKKHGSINSNFPGFFLCSSIDFYTAKKIFELTNYENKFLRELPLFNLQIFLLQVWFQKCTKQCRSINSSNIYVVSNRNFQSNINVLGRSQYLDVLFDEIEKNLYKICILEKNLVQIDIVWYIFEIRLQAKIFASWTKATLLKIYFRNLSVQRSFLQHKILGPGISPRLLCQARQQSWRADMCRRLIPGTIWKISCHKLFITYFTLTFLYRFYTDFSLFRQIKRQDTEKSVYYIYIYI
jgi:hypothetical protein